MYCCIVNVCVPLVGLGGCFTTSLTAQDDCQDLTWYTVAKITLAMLGLRVIVSIVHLVL